MANTLKILVATEKPFAAAAVSGIRETFDKAGMETILLEKYATLQDLLRLAADADGIIVRSDRITQEVVSAAKQLKVVARAGAGYDNIDLAACSARGIAVMNTPGQNANAVAELAVGLMLLMARNAFTQGTGSELMGRRLGIHGYGSVGRRVAALCKVFGMSLTAYDAHAALDNMFNDGALPAANAEELYSQCDVVSIHIPANDETRKSVNAALVGLMPQGGILINTARREVVDEEGLLALLQKRKDLRYATDTAPANVEQMRAALGVRYFATEKKMGAETTEANINAGLAAARQIVSFFADGDRTFVVNK